jgi:Glycosyl Hydrolase Family 88
MKSFFGFHAFTFLCCSPHAAAARMLSELVAALSLAASLISASARPEPDAAATAVPAAHLDYAPGKAPKFWSVATAETIMARWPDYTKAYFGSWTYVNGYAFYGFEMLYRLTGDQRYFDYIKRYIDQFIDSDGEFHGVANAKGQVRDVRFGNLDSMMTGNTVVMLWDYTQEPRYRKAAEKIRRAFDDYPRNHDGGFWHSRGMFGQMWIDGIFMGQMFLTRCGRSIGDASYCWDEAAKQLTVYAQRAQRDQTGLYLHGIYEAGHSEKAAPKWADHKTGLSPEVWSEGLGWKEYGLSVQRGYKGITENAKINSQGLVDIYSACDGVGVQSSYDYYINYKKMVNAKEAVAGFLWATAMVEKPELAKLKTRAAKP